MAAAVDRSTHRRRRAPLIAAAALVAALAVAGCSQPTGLVVQEPSAPEAAPSAPVASAPAGTPPTGPDDPASDGQGAVAGECGGELAALDAVITEQLDAFAANDWDRAWSLTSRDFRASGVDADGLREIVTSGYPEVADPTGHEVRGCQYAGEQAQVLITVTATDGSTVDLVYLLTREGGRWRISGAVDHDAGQTEPGTTTA